MTPRVQLVVVPPDGRRSDARVDGTGVTAEILDAAEDLLHTLTSGSRPLLENLYEVCANAFGTTRADAKRRLTGSLYGKRSQRRPPP